MRHPAPRSAAVGMEQGSAAGGDVNRGQFLQPSVRNYYQRRGYGAGAESFLDMWLAKKRSFSPLC